MQNIIIRRPLVAAAWLQILLLLLLPRQVLHTSKFSLTGFLLQLDSGCFIRLNLGLVTKSVFFAALPFFFFPAQSRLSRPSVDGLLAKIFRSNKIAPGCERVTFCLLSLPKISYSSHLLSLPVAPGIAAPSSQTQMVQNWVMKPHSVLRSTLKARWPYAAVLNY